jgi:exodeoxyribonuclease (lambda-induced)
MKIYRDIEQGTSEWFELRKGKITGSVLPKLISCKTFKAFSGETFETEIANIVGSNYIQDDGDVGFKTQAMEEGHIGEVEARKIYEANLPFENTLTEAAFLESDCGRYGFSPDGLVDNDGFIEIKTIFNTGKYVKAIQSNCQNLLYTDKYYMQVMMGFIVNPDFKYCDFICYNLRMPKPFNYYCVRITRDDEAVNKVKEVLENELLQAIESLNKTFKNTFIE